MKKQKSSKRVARKRWRPKVAIALTTEDEHSLKEAREHPDKGGYPRLKTMFAKYGFRF